MNKADDTGFVNQISHPSSPVQLLDSSVFVGNKRKINVVLNRELSVRRDAVGADANDFCIQLFECFQIPLEVNEFIGSDRRKSGKIERQYDIGI